jgi:GT2 family glycosyltransferase
VRLYDTITPAERAAFHAEQQRMAEQPLFSILLPVYNAQLDWLKEAIDSVKAQIYSRWELCIADDASTESGLRPFLKGEAKSDERIKLVFRGANGHISACSNSALALATGDWCGLLDQDDVLSAHALSLMAREVSAHPEAGLIYSDEDFLDQNGARTNPFIKPDWNPELFLGQNYLNHFGVYRTDLLRVIGGFREGLEGSQDYDLALRCVELLHRGQIRHIPRVLYHWRMVPGSLAEVRDAKPYAKEAARRALSDHVRRRGIAARVEPCPENVESHRVTYLVPDPAPLVSIISDGSYKSYGTYPSYEIVQASAGETVNGAAARAKGTVLVLLGSGVEIAEPGWLEELVSQAARVEVAAVGARIWHPDGTLQHGGFLLGLGGIAGHAHEGLPRGHPGFFNRTLLQRNCSAVSAACFATRTSVFRELNGFDEVNLAHQFHDVDFCLRAIERGLQVVWTPYVNPILHGAPAPQPTNPADAQYMRKRWGAKLLSDPFYSPSLTLDPPAFELAFPPRWLR